MMRLKFPSQAAAKDLTMEHFDKQVEFVLGKTVYQLDATDGAGRVVAQPNWPQVL